MKTLVAQIGYDGSLSVGAIEDEIRFYQRRSMEALLECDKRLLLLRGKTGWRKAASEQAATQARADA